jgi:hypothetical protein
LVAIGRWLGDCVEVVDEVSVSDQVFLLDLLEDEGVVLEHVGAAVVLADVAD